MFHLIVYELPRGDQRGPARGPKTTSFRPHVGNVLTRKLRRLISNTRAATTVSSPRFRKQHANALWGANAYGFRTAVERSAPSTAEARHTCERRYQPVRGWRAERRGRSAGASFIEAGRSGRFCRRPPSDPTRSRSTATRRSRRWHGHRSTGCRGSSCRSSDRCGYTSASSPSTR